MSDYYGDFAIGGQVEIEFNTTDPTASPPVPFALAGGTIQIARGGTNVTPSGGVTFTASFGSVVGRNRLVVNMASDLTTFTAGEYVAYLSAGTVNGASVVGSVVGKWSVQKRYMGLTVLSGVVGPSPTPTGFTILGMFPAALDGLVGALVRVDASDANVGGFERPILGTPTVVSGGIAVTFASTRPFGSVNMPRAPVAGSYVTVGLGGSTDMPVSLPYAVDTSGVAAVSGANMQPSPATDYDGQINLDASHHIRLDWGGDGDAVSGWDFGQANLALTQVLSVVAGGGFGFWIGASNTYSFVRFPTSSSAVAYTRNAGSYVNTGWSASGVINPGDTQVLTINPVAKTAILTINGVQYGATIPFAAATPTNVSGMYMFNNGSSTPLATAFSVASYTPPASGSLILATDRFSGGFRGMSGGL